MQACSGPGAELARGGVLDMLDRTELGSRPGWRAAVQAVPGRDQTGQRRNIALALDTARIGGQTLLQAVAREQAGGPVVEWVRSDRQAD